VNTINGVEYVGLDIGTEESGLAVLRPTGWPHVMVLPNEKLIDLARSITTMAECRVGFEGFQNYGFPPSKALINSIFWAGRLWQVFTDRGVPPVSVPRTKIKLELLGVATGNDAAIRRRIISIYGGDKAIGTKTEPGPLYAVTSHGWQALAVALVFAKLDGGLPADAFGPVFPDGVVGKRVGRRRGR
jgi:hypothetical protein